MLRKKLTTIGTVELVSLPNDGIYDVPAKIDTGADSSSIWATNIKIKDGKLSFVFFGPRSVFHTRQSVATTAFKTTSVKNSFGHAEFRYKIKLKLKIGKRTITSWFSLSDRSRSTYPILLGKNILKNRFVVDVANRYLTSDKQPLNEVFVLTNKPKEMEPLFEQVSAANKLTVKYRCAEYSSLLFNMSPSAVQVSCVAPPTETDIAQYAFVYFKAHVKNAEMAAALAEYLNYKAVPFVDKELGQYTSNSKLTEYMKLACHNLPLPTAICAKTEVLKHRFSSLKSELGLPFVLKEIASDRGRNNYLISSSKDFAAILAEAPGQHVYIAQKYIPNDGFLRLYILGREVALVVRRTAELHKNPLRNHLNKPAGGRNAKLVEPQQLPSDIQDIAIRAAECMNRQVAGVDIVQDKKTKKWYILEVNNAPQLRKGSFVEEKSKVVAKYFDDELSR